MYHFNFTTLIGVGVATKSEKEESNEEKVTRLRFQSETSLNEKSQDGVKVLNVIKKVHGIFHLCISQWEQSVFVLTK